MILLPDLNNMMLLRPFSLYRCVISGEVGIICNVTRDIYFIFDLSHLFLILLVNNGKISETDYFIDLMFSTLGFLLF